MGRDKRWWVPGILLIALVLRVIALESRSLEYDDAFSILLAERSLGEIIAGTAADTMPPLYYILLHFWMAIFHSIWFMRLLNIGLSLGIVMVSIQIGLIIGGDRVGWVAGILTALSPLQIFHAQGLRMYVVMTLSTLTFAWFLLRLLQAERDTSRSIRDWGGLILSGTVAMYSHNLAIFGLAAPTVVLLAQRRWRLLGRLLLAQLAIGLMALPWLIRVPGQVAKIQAAFWTPRPGFLEIVQTLVTFHTNIPVPDGFLPVALLISGWLLVFLILEIRRFVRGHPDIQLLIGFAILPPGLLFLVSYLMRPVFVPRAMMASSVIYYVLLALAILQTRVRVIGVGVGLAFGLSALAVLPAQYSFSSFPRSPYREAISFLSSEYLAEDVIVHDNKLSHFPSRVYDADLPQTFLPDIPGSHNQTLALPTQQAMDIYPVENLETAVVGAERIWFVVFERAEAEYRSLGWSEHPELAWLEANYSFQQKRAFNDLLVYEYRSQ